MLRRFSSYAVSTVLVVLTSGADAQPAFQRAWGTQDSGNGQFLYPHGIAIDSRSAVYVVDYNLRVQKFDPDGEFMMRLGSRGSGQGQFMGLYGVAADAYNHRIQVSDANGNFLTKWGHFGDGEGQLHRPRGIAIDANDNIYVVDTDNHRVQKFGSLVAVARTDWGQVKGLYRLDGRE